MTTVFVTYPGNADMRFDRDHYVRVHLPLVMETWSRYGLESVAAFFPAGNGAGTIAICTCSFRDEAAVHAAFRSPEAERVMADIPSFTDSKPLQSLAAPL